MKLVVKNLLIMSTIMVLLTGCSESSKQAEEPVKANRPAEVIQEISSEGETSSHDTVKPDSNKPVVTFIELGSVNCIPCRMMVPVMENIETTYGSQVKVVFYDVWTSEGRPYGQKYGIRAIPTQVFLDSTGHEFARHEGFLPFEEVQKILHKGGVK